MKQKTTEHIEYSKLPESPTFSLKLFSSAVEQTADAVFITDTNGVIQYANPAFENLTGFSKKEALGKTPRIIKSGLQSLAHYKKLWTTILAGKVFRSVVVNKKKNGELFYADHTITPIRNQKGKVKNFVGIWKDITEQMLFDKRKDEFISIAGHELKTPITSIKLYTQILQKHFDKKRDKKASYFLSNINVQVDKLTGLVNELLDISKIKSGKLTFRKELFDLNELVKKIVVDMQYITDKHTIIRNGEIEQKIYADKDRIEQALINLINNAIKYSPKAQKVIVHVSREKQNAIVGVQDFGIGISKKDQEKIFEPFYRILDKSNKETSGLGMGLHITKEIIALHDGKIWVESEKGKGSTFYFTLPL